MHHSINIAADRRSLVSIEHFEIPEDRITLLLGESGIGKSLIAKALYGLLDLEELTVTVDHAPYAEYLTRPATRALEQAGFFVFQEPSTHLNPLLTLRTQLHEGTLASAPDDRAILEELWDNTPLDELASLLDVYPKPYRPSGGEKQRMLLAMAFKKIDRLLERDALPSSAVFVFDEPTGSLDNYFRDVFLAMLFRRFRKAPFTTLLITHDYSMIGQIHAGHADLIPKISFKELRLEHDALVEVDFNPALYLDWLKKQTPADVPGQMGSTKPLLSLASPSGAFGRSLHITSDAAGAKPATLELHPGAMVYLRAPSGTGKTTIVKILMGLIQSDEFDARFDDLDLTAHTPRSVWEKHIWGKKMTMVFQHADEALNPESTVRQVFALLPNKKRTTDEDVIKTMIELFDPDVVRVLLQKKVKTLSGGQKQRVNLLRGLFLDTDILILDEPLNGLDFVSTMKVIALLQRNLHSGRAILLISHNEEIFSKLVHSDQTYYLQATVG